MMFFSRSTFFLLQLLTISESLRCAVECPWIGFPLNRPVPFGACRHEERADAQCSVSVEIDFTNRWVNGELYMQKRTTFANLKIDSKFHLEKNSIISTVEYTCAMSDYCDYDFLNELMTNQLADFDSTNVHEKLRHLLYTSTLNTTDVQCSNRVCSADKFCQAELINMITSQYNYTSINESLPCTTLSSNDNFVQLTETFSVPHIQQRSMIVRCNTDKCNNNQIISNVYAFLRNDFILPLNYSILQINDTHVPTGTASLSSTVSLYLFFLVLFQQINGF